MRQDQLASPDAIEPGMLWNALRTNLPKLVIATLAVGAATFGICGAIAPRFQSEAQLTIDAAAANPFNDPKQASQGSDTASQMDREAINTHIKSLQSPTLAAKIVDGLKLRDKVEFNAALGDLDTVSMALRTLGLGGPRAGQTEQDRVLEAYFHSLEVYSAKESRFIGLRFTSTDPQLAADIPNALAEAYRQQLAGRKVDETRDVQDALLPKIEQLTRDVTSAEGAVEQFRGKTDSFNTGAQKQTLNEQQLGELTSEWSRAQAARSEAEARARSATELMRSGSGEVLPDVQKSPLIQNLVQSRVRAERQVAEVSATLLPGHPRMQQLNADLAGLKKQIAAEVAKIVDGIGKEAKVAAERELAIKQRLSQLKTTVVNAGPDEAQLKMLVADAKSKRDELERLQAQYNVNRTRAESKAVPVEAKILSPAYPSSVPVFPKKGATAALASAATLLVGLAAIILTSLAKGARSPAPVPHRPLQATAFSGAHNHELSAEFAPLGRSFAVVREPETKPPTVLALEKAVTPPNTLSLDDADALITHILEATGERGGYRTIVTGSTQATQATALAIALAKGLAEANQPVILVEWTYRTPLIAASVGLDPALGLAELLNGSATFENVITALPGSDCHFIAAGTALEKSAATAETDQLNLVLDSLDEAYAHIIISGDHDSVKHGFELIQGRCDAGVTTGPSIKSAASIPDVHAFLGFEVTGIDIIHVPNNAKPTQVSSSRSGLSSLSWARASESV